VAENDGDKSQEPTQHRRQQAREQGQVAQSQDLTSAALLLGMLIVLTMAGRRLFEFMGLLVARQLGGGVLLSADSASVVANGHAIIGGLAKALLPILLVGLGLAIGINLMQVGPLFLSDKLAPDLTRLDPLQGLSRIFSIRSLMRLMFGIFKLIIIASVALVSLYDRQQEILNLAALDLTQSAWFTWEICFWTAVKIGVALLILSLLDYFYQWWRQEQDLRMSPQEMREEMRNLQGDPQVMARRRAVQRQLAAHRLSKAVPKADVVVTNPTELAVALEYDPESMNAPIVVAKGAGLLAQQIRRLALKHGVPILERKPLAQALYRDVELNHPVPDQLYATVAEVLAYVYQLKGKKIPKIGQV
jgi:flagellar biosynthesis protein FlhB